MSALARHHMRHACACTAGDLTQNCGLASVVQTQHQNACLAVPKVRQQPGSERPKSLVRYGPSPCSCAAEAGQLRTDRLIQMPMASVPPAQAGPSVLAVAQVSVRSSGLNASLARDCDDQNVPTMQELHSLLRNYQLRGNMAEKVVWNCTFQKFQGRSPKVVRPSGRLYHHQIYLYWTPECLIH